MAAVEIEGDLAPPATLPIPTPIATIQAFESCGGGGGGTTVGMSALNACADRGAAG
ncbi:MAG: hypothetical protein KME26_22455 [Oscillatoria princeps RMCB-10]|nr:hypothetical protein [Oscillatoria princeps RMCB-10]